MTKEEFDAIPEPKTIEDLVSIFMRMRYKTEFIRSLFCLSYDNNTGLYSARFLFAKSDVIKNLLTIGRDPETVMWKLYSKLQSLYNGVVE